MMEKFIKALYNTEKQRIGFAGGVNMKIKEIRESKRDYLPLLLLGDEQENMIEKYLGRGTMFVLEDGAVLAECVVTDEGSGILEIKNIAVSPPFRRRGYGRYLICFLERLYRSQYKILQAGTGDSPLTITFYRKCGFTESHRIKNFFTDNYDHPIIENGVLLDDMVYMRKNLN